MHSKVSIRSPFHIFEVCSKTMNVCTELNMGKKTSWKACVGSEGSVPGKIIRNFIHCNSNPFSESFADNEKWSMSKNGGNAFIVQIMAMNEKMFHYEYCSGGESG